MKESTFQISVVIILMITGILAYQIITKIIWT